MVSVLADQQPARRIGIGMHYYLWRAYLSEL
jgi:hypothetical protein